MSRRPVENRERPERGGDGRRYRWSESPIPRASFRRVRRVGVPVVATFVATATASGDRGIYWYSARDAGDVLVAVAVARASVTAPSGWTDLATGSVGACYYCVAYATSAGGAANSIEGTFGGAADCSIYGWALRSTSTLTPTVKASSTGTAATTCPYGAVSGVQPVQVVGLCSVAGTAVGGYWDPDYSSQATTLTAATGTRLTGTYPSGAGAPDGPFPGACDFIASQSSDFVSLVVSV